MDPELVPGSGINHSGSTTLDTTYWLSTQTLNDSSDPDPPDMYHFSGRIGKREGPETTTTKCHKKLQKIREKFCNKCFDIL